TIRNPCLNKNHLEKLMTFLRLCNRTNLEISNAIKKDGVSLNAKQSKKLKELMSISNIKYGY
ncbi:hypothetical protein P7G90_14655, partial [Enterococcus faecalis]|nr:hypothetical protein [Enterococcus faecalis]